MQRPPSASNPPIPDAISVPFPSRSSRPKLALLKHETRPKTTSNASLAPGSAWLLPDVTSPTFSASSVERGLPSPNLAIASRAHSRSGSSSGDLPRQNLGRLSFRPPSRKLCPEFGAIDHHLEIKRLLSKPAATVTSHSSYTTDDKPLHRPRKAASSDSASVWRNKTSSTDHQLLSSSTSTPPSHPIERSISHRAYVDTRPAQTLFSQSEQKRQANVLRRKNSNRIPRSSPNSPSHSYPHQDNHPPLPSKPIPRPLTPAAAIAKAYRDSERRRERLAKEASFTEPPKSPFSDSPTSSESKLSTPSTAHDRIDLIDVSIASPLTRSSSFKFSLSQASSYFGIRRTPSGHFSGAATDGPNEKIRRRPSTATEIRTTSFTRNPTSGCITHDDTQVETAAASEAPKGSKKLWGLVRKLSHGNLKDRRPCEAQHPHTPPVPSPSLHFAPSAAQLSSVETGYISQTASPSSPRSKSSPASHGLIAQTPQVTESRHSATPSCRSVVSDADPSRDPTGIDVNVTKQLDSGSSTTKRSPNSTAVLPPSNKSHVSLALPSPFNFSRSLFHAPKAVDGSHSPVSNFQPGSQEFGVLAGHVTSAHLQSPRDSSMHKDLKDRFWATFVPRKSVDVTRLPVKSRDHPRRRTKSLDKSGPRHTTISFRELGHPTKALTEKERNDRWEELLLRSERAGGTIVASATPISLRIAAAPSP